MATKKKTANKKATPTKKSSPSKKIVKSAKKEKFEKNKWLILGLIGGVASCFLIFLIKTFLN